ncbi:MAG TPA: C39 family peptidase, partial [Chthoniobacteraceae bacterium]|nr:C39 family peptidase [Chthoniobacteraceae bacterium]
MFNRSVGPVTGYFENGRLISLSVVVLDSGAWFGFVPDDQAKAAAASRGAEFARQLREISADVTAQLGRIAASHSEVVLGSTPWLKQRVTVARTGTISARLTIIADQLVKLSLFRDHEDASQLLDGARRALTKASQAQTFAAAVHSAPSGDRIITNIPVFPQGDRAYCGVSALACVMRLCGLTLDTEEFAAAAGIRFGSTRKSHIREVYDAAGKEAAVRMFHSTKFEFARAQQTIDAGFPVVVFRRWNQERDFLHSAFARRIASDSAVELPRPDANDQKNWPRRDGYAHAS